ncbi:MAG: alanine racemase [Firmicutes bacterium]|nr:alanine racemase [Bacillota bacterium]
MESSVFEKLTAEGASPCFVFDIDALRARAREIRDMLSPAARLCYSIKANPFFIPELADIAGALEVCSPGELEICKAYGVDPARIIYSGVNKERWDLKDAADYGAGTFTAESLRQLAYLNDEGLSRGKRLPVLLRLNGGTQFGMSAEDLEAAVMARGELAGVEIVGLHFFQGTQRKEKRQAEDIRFLTEFLASFEERTGFRFGRLEYGPGLKVPYFEGDDFSDTLAPARALAEQLPALAEGRELTVEMGRFIAAECGFYLSRVMDIKENGGICHAILDGGMNHLVYYGQTMAMKTPKMFRIPGCEGPEGLRGASALPVPGAVRGRKWFLYGSLCSIHDIICKDVLFDELAAGDFIVFENCGAYSVTEGIYLFLSRSMPRVYFAKGGELRLVREGLATSPFNRAENA